LPFSSASTTDRAASSKTGSRLACWFGSTSKTQTGVFRRSCFPASMVSWYDLPAAGAAPASTEAASKAKTAPLW